MSKFFDDKRATRIAHHEMSRFGNLMWKLRVFEVYSTEYYQTCAKPNKWHPVFWIIAFVMFFIHLGSPMFSEATLGEAMGEWADVVFGEFNTKSYTRHVKR